MDEIQSWWEVPAVAHFCYVFRAAFNLFYSEIAELEAAILDVQDPEMCISLEQLITRLLQGYYEDSVTPENWEEKLNFLFSTNCKETDENPFAKNISFYEFSPRRKVEVLLKLCEYRLDASDALEAIKDIPPEAMKAKCVGRDIENNVYWYFCDERLYKEIPSSSSKIKKESLSISKESKNSKVLGIKNGRMKKAKRNSLNHVDDSWSIVCHNLSDWEAFIKHFSKRKNLAEKELVNTIKNEYLPMLQDVVAEKSRLLRKRFLELAPKRTSSRISKVQAQKKMEEQKVAEAAEKAKIEFEQEQAKREVKKKKREIEDRQKRVEERHKAIEERAKRAEQREQSRFIDESHPREVTSEISRTRHVINRRKNYCQDRDSSSETSGDECTTETKDNASSGSKNSSESETNNSGNSDSECESGSESENSECNDERSNVLVKKQVMINTLDRKQFSTSSVVKNSYEFTNWNSSLDSKGRKLHILHSDYDELSAKKRFKSHEDKNYRNGAFSGIKSSFVNEKIVLKSFHESDFNSYSRVTPSSSIIRLNFLKPPSKQISS